MGELGTPAGTVLAESFSSTQHTELFNRSSWPTRDVLRVATFDFVEVFYDRQRRQSHLGNLSPGELREEVVRATSAGSGHKPVTFRGGRVTLLDVVVAPCGRLATQGAALVMDWPLEASEPRVVSLVIMIVSIARRAFRTAASTLGSAATRALIVALTLMGTCLAQEPVVLLRGDAEMFRSPVLSSSGSFVVAGGIEAQERVSVVIDVDAAVVRDVFPLFGDIAGGGHYPIEGDIVAAFGAAVGQREFFDIATGLRVEVSASIATEPLVHGSNVVAEHGRVNFNLGWESGCNANWCLSFVLSDLGQVGNPERFWLRNPPYIRPDGVVIVGNAREGRTHFFSLFDPVPPWNELAARDSVDGEFVAAFRIMGDERLFGLFRDAPPNSERGFVVDLEAIDASRVGLRDDALRGGLASGPATAGVSVIGMPEPVARLDRLPTGRPSFVPSLWIDVDQTCAGTVWRWETPHELVSVRFAAPSGCYWDALNAGVPTISSDGRRLLIPARPEWLVLELPEW